MPVQRALQPLDVPIDSTGRVLWTLDELPGSYGVRRRARWGGTCTLDPGRASGGVTESEDVPAGTTVWTRLGLRGCLESAFLIFASSYYTPGRASTTDESQRHQMVPSGPWTSLQHRQTSPLGSQMCQLDSQGAPAWVYVQLPPRILTASKTALVSPRFILHPWGQFLSVEGGEVLNWKKNFRSLTKNVCSAAIKPKAVYR